MAYDTEVSVSSGLVKVQSNSQIKAAEDAADKANAALARQPHIKIGRASCRERVLS